MFGPRPNSNPPTSPAPTTSPLDTLGEHATALARHVNDPVVLVCRSGTRASLACDTLAATDMTNVHILDGGMEAWVDGDRPVHRGRQRWDLERPARLVAGSLVLAGVAGSLKVPRLKYVSGLVGAGLTFAALTNTSAMGRALSRLPYNRTSCDVDRVVRDLTEASRR
jgi:hypothetical protein